LEDGHAVDTLGPETVREGVVTVEVLFEGAAEDGFVAIGGEGTGEYGDTEEGRG